MINWLGRSFSRATFRPVASSNLIGANGRDSVLSPINATVHTRYWSSGGLNRKKDEKDPKEKKEDQEEERQHRSNKEGRIVHGRCGSTTSVVTGLGSHWYRSPWGLARVYFAGRVLGEHEDVLSVDKLPPKFDWRSRGVVTPIRSQGNFGNVKVYFILNLLVYNIYLSIYKSIYTATCWAFAATAVMESLHAIKTGKLLVLAPQLLIDCVESEKKFGWVDKSFDWVISSSGSCMSLEKDYPYVGLAGPCMRNIVPVQPICIDNHAYITYASDDQMMQVVAKQPVVVGIKGCYAFNSYTDAIYRAPEVEVTNHFIVLIGYDTINGVDCWIGRNSWGEKWGMNGYVYIERLKGSRVGVGGINLLVQYPTFGARPYRKMRGRSEEKLRKFDVLIGRCEVGLKV
ncbi:ervatamin-B-like [Tripterygium wilfordii]|uniref:ervatamin-B-like n=1 Tax=Tripterygium wilfordii TaxID=458696 RepID=UPI0018F80539|nr:ervatamin-B-like [Tripterygium wilfordii]